MPNVLDNHLDKLKKQCDWALKMYYDTLSLYNENSMGGFTSDMKDMIIENVILKTYSCWERFLENVFISYMLGAKSDNGDEVITYVSPKDIEHAYKLIKNVTPYPDWTDINKILVNAENFFEDCGSFKVLKTINADLNAIKKIRNAIAHISKSAKQEFENLVRGKVGHLPDNITPVKFLSNYRINKRRNSSSYFEYYIEFLKNSAIMLVEFRNEV